MNFLPCRLEQAGGGLRVRLSDDIVLPVPPSRAGRYRGHVGRDGLTFGLRPEHLTECKPNGDAQLGYVDAVLDVTEPMGMETLVFFRVNGLDVCARVSPNAGAREGAPMRLAREPRQHAPDRRCDRAGDLIQQFANGRGDRRRVGKGAKRRAHASRTKRIRTLSAWARRACKQPDPLPDRIARLCPPTPALAPQRPRRGACAFDQALEFRPHDLRFDLRPLARNQGRGKAAIGAGDHALPPDHACEPHDALGHELGVLDEHGRMA